MDSEHPDINSKVESSSIILSEFPKPPFCKKLGNVLLSNWKYRRSEYVPNMG